jgi:tRNA U34 5-methylaminomethyl-2-thiouridine-forming methyltransferase MnmC
MTLPGHFTPQPTEDGSFTFFSQQFGEMFHSHYGACQEADLKFVQPCILPHKAHQHEFRILDVCYGLGYNTAAALEWIWAINPNCLITVVALELDATVPQTAIAHNLLNLWNPAIQQDLATLATQGQIQTQRLHATLHLGDARQTIQAVQSTHFDAVFLDPFSPPHCPQLWTVEFLAQVARCLQPTGRLTTYSCAAAVRTALLATGLFLGVTQAIGRRSPGTVASFTQRHLPPLSTQAQEHLRTKAAVPYRDPNLKDSPLTILERRKQEKQQSPLEPTSYWKKRWSIESDL